MISWRRHSERITAAAIALLLQAALYWALSQREVSLPMGVSGPRLAARILTVTRPKREAPAPVQAGARLLPVPVMEHPVMRAITLSQPPTHTPAFDWQAGIQDEVRAEHARAHAQPKLRFDFPRLPATEGPAAEFGWDVNHLHRIQRLAHGIIDLGHNGCVVVIWPPFAGCFSEPANGDLFKDMHREERLPGPHTLP